MTLDFAEVVRRRRMVRSFTGEPVAPEVVTRILDTARRGPSAGYSQAVEFVVVTDRQTRRRMVPSADGMLATSGHPNFVVQAPVHIVLCTNPETYRSRYREPDKQQVIADWTDEQLWRTPYWHTDAGAALLLMLLAAVNEGVAAAFISGEPDPDHLRTLLGIPPDYLPIGIVLLGHEARDAGQYGDVSAKPRRRRPLADIVHYGHWG